MVRYTAIYERDEAGWWVARIQAVEGVRANGRTISEARRRVRVALASAIGDEAARRAELAADVKLPADLLAGIASYRETKAAERRAQKQALAVARALSEELRQKLGLSIRDVGELLGISYQRVHQIEKEPRIPSE